jgi:hypothetical protein
MLAGCIGLFPVVFFLSLALQRLKPETVRRSTTAISFNKPLAVLPDVALEECCCARDVEALVSHLLVSHHGDGEREKGAGALRRGVWLGSAAAFFRSSIVEDDATAWPSCLHSLWPVGGPPQPCDGCSISWPQADLEALLLRLKVPQGCRPKWSVPGDDILAPAVEFSWHCGGEEPEALDCFSLSLFRVLDVKEQVLLVVSILFLDCCVMCTHHSI